MTEQIKSPLDRAIAARNSQPRNPHPDPRTARLQRERNVPACPLDISEGAIRGDVVALGGARSAMDTVRHCWEAIRDAARETEDVRRLARDATRLTERATRAVDNARGRLEEAERGLVAQMRERVEVPLHPALAAEIRQAAAAMDGSAGLADLVRTDARVASAILTGPAFLSGVDNKTQASLRDVAELAHAPEQVEGLRQVRRAKDQVDAAGSRVISELVSRVVGWEAAEPSAVTKMRDLANG